MHGLVRPHQLVRPFGAAANQAFRGLRGRTAATVPFTLCQDIPLLAQLTNFTAQARKLLAVRRHGKLALWRHEELAPLVI